MGADRPPNLANGSGWLGRHDAKSLGQQTRPGVGIFSLELVNQCGCTLHLVNGPDALTATPNIFPGFGLVAAKVHFAGVALRQIIRVHAGIADGWCQVIAVNAREQVAVDNIV